MVYGRLASWLSPLHEEAEGGESHVTLSLAWVDMDPPGLPPGLPAGLPLEPEVDLHRETIQRPGG